jgi:hypothetical protein
MILMLAIIASLLIAGTFVYTKNDEKERFEAEINALADQVIDSFHASVCNQLATMDALSVSYTSYVERPFPTLPFLTMKLRAPTPASFLMDLYLIFSL